MEKEEVLARYNILQSKVKQNCHILNNKVMDAKVIHIYDCVCFEHWP